MTVDRRLDLLTSELTARERAVLCLRAWCRGERVDDRITRYCPPQDKPEMERICNAVERGNGEANGYIGMLMEWVANLESELEWLRVLTIYQEHLAKVEKLAASAVPAIPRPWKLERRVPMAWGRLTPGDDPVPRTWKQFRELQLKGLRTNLQQRWQDARSYELAFDELASALGEPLIHHEVAEHLGWLRENVLRLTRELAELDAELELPEPSDAQMEVSMGHFDWEVIRAAPKEKHAREWMHDAQRADLEAFEREQAESVRNRS